jgi:hypothetical protein
LPNDIDAAVKRAQPSVGDSTADPGRVQPDCAKLSRRYDAVLAGRQRHKPAGSGRWAKFVLICVTNFAHLTSVDVTCYSWRAGVK